ncbi:ribonuclease H-like domain-containing protein [Tanacetum coccineum]
MEEYIRLDKEKDQKHGKVFNWETTKYGKIWYDKDVLDLRSVETEFPAIVFNDNLTSNETPSCEPTISSLNDEIDFKISFDESNDEDYMVVFNKNLFSYKIISTNDLKTNLENDNEKVNKPLFPSPEPTISYFSTEPTLCPQHIDEFDFKDETSLSKYDEEEQNVLYYNDLFPFKIIYPDDLKSDKGNDDNKIDMIQSSRGKDGLQERIQRIRLKPIRHMAPLPPRDQRHIWLYYQVVGYTEEIVHDFEQRLETIFGRQVNRVHILDFEGLTPNMRIRDEMGLDVAGTLCFQLGGARRSMTWRQFILALGFHTAKEMAKEEFGAYWFWCERGQTPKKVTATDLFYLRSMDRRAVNVSYLLVQYLFRYAEWRKSGARLSGHFIGRLAHHFGLVCDDGLRGLSVMAPANQPPPPPLAAGRTMPQSLWRLEEEIQGLHRDVRILRGLDDTGFIDSGCSRHMTGISQISRNLMEVMLHLGDEHMVVEFLMCDKKNYVLFADTECLVLSPNFKLPDESQILLKIPRKDNMYSFDMKNIVPKESLTCLVAKATSDESMLWHRRLGHINFMIINKLVKYNLVRDETSEILKNFIKEIENLVDTKVKIFRSDNGTEFKNQFLDDFCREKGIKREYSVAMNPQQNSVAVRRNMTLIETAITMLADSKLPTTFWAEAVSIACYVQNRVLVVKPHNKKPYELFRGFM